MGVQFIPVIIISIMVSLNTSVRAETWHRTDRASRNLTRVTLQLQNSLRKIKKTYQGTVERHLWIREEQEDTILKAEINLIEAFENLLFMAYQSPNRARYLKHVYSQRVDFKLFKELQLKVKRLPKKVKKYLEPFVTDQIVREAESLAKNTIRKARRDLRTKM